MTPLVALAALALPPACGPSSDGPGTAAEFAALGDEAVQDLVILGDSRPFFLRLRIKNGDRPFRAAWLDGVDTLRKALDRDGDGKLTPDEASKGGFDAMFAPPTAAGAQPRRHPALDSNKDGAISSEELAEGLRATAAPFRLRIEGDGQARADALFDHIDRDQDGRLDRSELDTLVGSLHKLDRDADELIDAEEVALIAASPVASRMTMAAGRPARDAGVPAVVELAPGESPVRLARLLLKKYDTGSNRGPGRKDSKLSPEEFAIPEAAFHAADRNRDGLLTAEELREHLARTPRDAILDVALPKDGSGPASAIVRGGEGGEPDGLTIRHPAPGVIEVDLGLLRLDLQVDDGAWSAESARKRLRALFAAADADANGYLEADETAGDNGQASPLSAAFGALDRDGDGKVYPRDLDDFADRALMAVRGILTLTASDDGRALFGMLDLDRDRRLGAREVLSASSRVSACDRDGDGRVAPEEIPHHIRLELTRGDLSGLLAPQVASPAAATVANIATPARSRPAAGPSWFRKMDRNRDGDVSRREFLGRREQFDRLDRDGDGLLSPEEAEAATPGAQTGK